MQRVRREGSLQNAQTEHAHDVGLLLPGEVETIQLSQRQRHHNDIQRHVDQSRGPALCVDVVAVVINLSIPVVPRARERFTLEDGNEDERNHVGDIETDDDVGGCAEPAFGEDTKVEAADGDFGQGEDAEVEQFIPEVDLSSSVS